MPKKQVILDFDSTLCAVESLDALAEMVLADDPDSEAKVAEIERLTSLGMSGELPLSESLARRLASSPSIEATLNDWWSHSARN